MAALDPNVVDRLVDLLRLPVGGEDDPRPESSADLIQEVSLELGSLVFEDTSWYDSYRPRDIQALLEPWFDDTTAAELVTRAAGPESPQAWQEFLGWCQQLVSAWRHGEVGVASGPQGAEAALLGTANPNFEPDRVPGTQFYRYADGEYLYAATADAATQEWRTPEERYDNVRADTVASSPGGMLMGYRNGSSVLPGTGFYRQLDDGDYVYAPTEYAAPDDWHAYEYWADQAEAEVSAPEGRFTWLHADPGLQVRVEKSLSYEPDSYEEHLAPYLEGVWGTGWEAYPGEHKRAWLDQLLTGLEEQPVGPQGIPAAGEEASVEVQIGAPDRPVAEQVEATATGAEIDATAVIADVLQDSPELAELGAERLQELFAEVMVEFESAEQPASAGGEP
jgi:hypothetical protein